jgi:hypothetical protein
MAPKAAANRDLLRGVLTASIDNLLATPVDQKKTKKKKKEKKSEKKRKRSSSSSGSESSGAEESDNETLICQALGMPAP